MINNKMATNNKSPRKTILPIYRIKTIMKTTPDVNQVSNDAYFVMTKATEMFIAFLTKEAYKTSAKNNLEYNNVAEVVGGDEVFDFLRELIPKKITVRKYKELMEKKEQEQNKDDKVFYL